MPEPDYISWTDNGEADTRTLTFEDKVLEYLELFNQSDKNFIEKQDKILKNQENLIKKEDELIKKQDDIISLLSKNKNVDYKEIDKILANNVQYIETNTRELIKVNKRRNDGSLSEFHSLYYLGSVMIGFFIGYVVINTFLQLAFDK